MSELCEHEKCGPGNRLDYCVPAAQEADGPANTVISIIDDLNSDEKLVSTKQSVEANADLTVQKKQFVYTEEYDMQGTQASVETKMNLTACTGKASGRSSYAVVVSWIVRSESLSDEEARVPLITGYHFTEQPDGTIAGIVKESSVLSIGETATRSMTGYDYIQLGDSLIKIYEYNMSSGQAD